MYWSNLSLSIPNSGAISSKALLKSPRLTVPGFVIWIFYEKSIRLWCLFNEKEFADLTTASISAPVKFLSSLARSFKSTSGSKRLFCYIVLVCIWRISNHPCSSGSPISTWTSNHPGLKTALSMRSSLLVIPITRMLLRESTPSIIERSWLTTLSLTPVSPLEVPLCQAMASNSSKITMCNGDSS